jgi:hypothetical protein
MSELARFESFIERIPIAGCWLWTGSLSGSGYGQFIFNGSLMGAHRASWIIVNGAIPSGMFICHYCDVKTCVNPAHLFAGSPLLNMQDMMEKGRDLLGRRKQGDKIKRLSDEEARYVIASTLSHAQLGKKFGVHRGTIQQIKARRTYKHL